MGGTRNKNAGSNYEREIANAFKLAGFTHAATSRLVNPHRDSLKIDIANKEEDVNGRLPYDAQCKTTTSKLDYEKLLNEIKPANNRIRVLFHRLTEKAGTRFMAKGRFAIVFQDDFFRLASNLNRYKLAFDTLNEYFDSIPEEEQPKVHKALEKLGL